MKKEVVLVTGISRGLGAALASTFIKSGYFVCGICRTQEGLANMQSTFSPQDFLGLRADVADPQEVNTAIEQLLSVTGRIDILFNNAAVYPKVNFLDETQEEWLYAININLGGIANLCKAVLPVMIQQQTGKIFNIGSWADIHPALNSVAYSTSKGGLHSLTKAIAKDIESLDLDIQVHEWIPGHLNTRMSEFTGIDPEVSAQWATKIVKMDPSVKSAIFENDHEWIPPLPLRRKIRNLLFFWK